MVRPQSSAEHWDPPTRGGSALACGPFRVELGVSRPASDIIKVLSLLLQVQHVSVVMGLLAGAKSLSISGIQTRPGISGTW